MDGWTDRSMDALMVELWIDGRLVEWIDDLDTC